MLKKNLVLSVELVADDSSKTSLSNRDCFIILNEKLYQYFRWVIHLIYFARVIDGCPILSHDLNKTKEKERKREKITLLSNKIAQHTSHDTIQGERNAFPG